MLVIWVVLVVFYTISLFILETLSHNEYFTGFEIIAHNATNISKNVTEIFDKKNLEITEAHPGHVKMSDDEESEFEQKYTVYLKTTS